MPTHLLTKSFRKNTRVYSPGVLPVLQHIVRPKPVCPPHHAALRHQIMNKGNAKRLEPTARATIEGELQLRCECNGSVACGAQRGSRYVASFYVPSPTMNLGEPMGCVPQGGSVRRRRGAVGRV